MQNQAYCESVAAANGSKKTYWERFELEGACPTCKGFDGAIALYSDTPLPDFAGDDTAEYAVWDGKEATGKNLVMGAIHPNCRGSWLEYVDGMNDEVTAANAEIDGSVAAWDKAVMKARADNPDKDYTSAEMYDVITENYAAFAGDKEADRVIATKREAQKAREARMKKSQGGEMLHKGAPQGNQNARKSGGNNADTHGMSNVQKAPCKFI